jgi:hypothetical protein
MSLLSTPLELIHDIILIASSDDPRTFPVTEFPSLHFRKLTDNPSSMPGAVPKAKPVASSMSGVCRTLRWFVNRCPRLWTARLLLEGCDVSHLVRLAGGSTSSIDLACDVDLVISPGSHLKQLLQDEVVLNAIHQLLPRCQGLVIHGLTEGGELDLIAGCGHAALERLRTLQLFCATDRLTIDAHVLRHWPNIHDLALVGNIAMEQGTSISWPLHELSLLPQTPTGGVVLLLPGLLPVCYAHVEKLIVKVPTTCRFPAASVAKSTQSIIRRLEFTGSLLQLWTCIEGWGLNTYSLTTLSLTLGSHLEQWSAPLHLASLESVELLQLDVANDSVLHAMGTWCVFPNLARLEVFLHCINTAHPLGTVQPPLRPMFPRVRCMVVQGGYCFSGMQTLLDNIGPLELHDLILTEGDGAKGLKDLPKHIPSQIHLPNLSTVTVDISQIPQENQHILNHHIKYSSLTTCTTVSGDPASLFGACRCYYTLLQGLGGQNTTDFTRVVTCISLSGAPPSHLTGETALLLLRMCNITSLTLGCILGCRHQVGDTSMAEFVRAILCVYSSSSRKEVQWPRLQQVNLLLHPGEHLLWCALGSFVLSRQEEQRPLESLTVSPRMPSGEWKILCISCVGSYVEFDCSDS